MPFEREVYAFLPCQILWSSLFSFFFLGRSLAWFLSFPQDTQKRYPYQGRLHLPLFCPCNAFLMSVLIFCFCCRFAFLLILFCSVSILLLVRLFQFVCLCSSKRKKTSNGGMTMRCLSCHTRPRSPPNTPEGLHAVIYICGSMSVSKICFIMPCVF